jgi:organic radical activating enzyme
MHDGIRNPIKPLFFIDRIRVAVNDLVAGQVINVLPVHAELDITSKCNMSCVWCRDLDRKYSRLRAGDMPLRIIEQAAEIVKAISLKGGGEPTLHPEFGRICELIHSRNIDLGMTTNGTVGIEHPEYFNWIKVSMDVWDIESLKHLKGFNTLDTILKNASEWSSKTKVGMSFLRHKGIRYEQCIELAKHSNVRYCVFREVFGYENEDVPDWLESGYVDDLYVQVEPPYLRTQNLGCWANCLVLHIGPDSGLNICCWAKYNRGPYTYATDERSILDCWKSKEHADIAREFLYDTSRCLDCRFKLYQPEIVRAIHNGSASLPSNAKIEDVNFI